MIKLAKNICRNFAIKSRITHLLRFIGSAAFFALVLMYMYFSFFGHCTRPACRILGVYTHKVNDINDYADFLNGYDILSKYSAEKLIFDCDELRKQASQEINEIMIQDEGVNIILGTGNSPLKNEIIRLGLLGARQDGATLRLMNYVIVGEGELPKWGNKFKLLLRENNDILMKLINNLFDKVILESTDGKRHIYTEKKFYHCS